MKNDAMRATLRVTKALADRQRVRILMMLQQGELCVCRIVEVLALAPSTVSKHLSILDAAGLVESRKDGRWAYYRLPKGAGGGAVNPLMKWLNESLKDEDSIAQDARALKRVLSCDAQSLCRRQRVKGRQ